MVVGRTTFPRMEIESREPRRETARNATEACDGSGSSRVWECLSLFVRRFQQEMGQIMGPPRRRRRRQCLSCDPILLSHWLTSRACEYLLADA